MSKDVGKAVSSDTVTISSHRVRTYSPNYLDYAYESDVNSDINDVHIDRQSVNYNDARAPSDDIQVDSSHHPFHTDFNSNMDNHALTMPPSSHHVSQSHDFDNHSAKEAFNENDSDEIDLESDLDTQIEAPEELKGPGFIINTRGKFLICTSCHRAVLGSIAVSHAHGHELRGFRKRLVETYIRHRALLNTEADLQCFLKPKSHVEFQGLETIDGYRCDHSPCRYVCGQKSTIQWHTSNAHQDLPFRPGHSIVKVQHAYFHPNSDAFLCVRTRLNTEEATDLKSLWDNNQSKLHSFAPLTILPTRELPPWLKILKWHKHLDSAKPDSVIDFLATLKNTKECKMFTNAVVSYLQCGMIRLDDMLPQIRQVLKSVTNEVENELFKEPESEATIPHYALFFGHLFTVYNHLIQLDSPPFPYFISSSQKQHLQALQRSLPCDDGQNLNVIHEALKSFLLYRYPPAQSTLSKDPVYMYVLWNNWNRDGSFNKPGSITKDYAKMAFIVKSVVLMDICFVHDAALEKFEEDGQIPGDQVIDYDILLEQRRPLMMQGTMTPMGTALSQWWIMNRASRDEISPPNFSFTDSVTCMYKSITISLDRFKTMIHAVIEEAEHTLYDGLFLGFYDPSKFPTPHDILDDPCNTKSNYSFLHDRRNNLQRQHEILLNCLLESDQNKYFYRSVAGTMVWNHANCQAYLLQCQHFLQNILVAMHLTHGQPTRGTELLASTFTNLPNYARTFMYHLNRLVNCVTASKIESLTEHRQISPHFLPQRVSDILVNYLVYIRPIETALAHGIFDNDTACKYKYYLFTGPRGQWKTTQFSDFLVDVTRKHLGPNSGLKLSDIRHVTLGIYREKCNSPFKDSDIKTLEGDFMESVGHLQANHGASVANNHYAVQPHEMGAIPSIKFKGCQKYSSDVHRLWGLIDEDDDPLQLLRCGVPTTTTTTPTTAAAATTVFNDTTLQLSLAKFMKDTQASLLEIEKRTNSVIRTSSAESAGLIIQALRNPLLNIPSYDHHPSYALLNHLKSVNPSFTTFKSEEQAMVVQALINRREHHLIVLPTGEGKTLAWMMAVKMLEHLTTIVVIPYVALLVDCHRRLQTLRIPFSTWSTTNDNPTTNVVLIDTHNAVSQSFKDYLTILVQRKRLAQVVIDEAHIILTESSFRPHLPRLRDLFSLGVPVQSLTATLPPHLEPRYSSVLNLSSLNIIRRHSTFDNARIAATIVLTKKDRLAMLQAKLRTWLPELEAMNGRGLIICRTVEDAIEVARMLGLPPYHGRLSDSEKRQVFTDWLNNTFRILVATIGCGTGIDLPDVYLVIHIGLPWNIMTYAQNIGRIRHQGIAFLIALERERQPSSQEISDGDLFGAAALRDMVFKDGTYCRKLALSTFMDGRPISCLSGRNLCDVCTNTLGHIFSFALNTPSHSQHLVLSPSPPPPSPSLPLYRQSSHTLTTPAKRISSAASSSRSVRPRLDFTPHHDDSIHSDPFLVHSDATDIQLQSMVRRSVGTVTRPLASLGLADRDTSPTIGLRVQKAQTQARQSNETDFHQRIVRALETLRGVCVICYLVEHKICQVSPNHQPFQCPVGRCLGNFYNTMKVRRVPYVGGSTVCLKCFLPDDGFSAYKESHGKGQASSDKCYFAHILKPFLWISWHHPMLRDIIVDFFGPVYSGKELKRLEDWESYFDWSFTRGPDDSMYSRMLFVFDLLYKITSEKVPL